MLWSSSPPNLAKGPAKCGTLPNLCLWKRVLADRDVWMQRLCSTVESQPLVSIFATLVGFSPGHLRDLEFFFILNYMPCMCKVLGYVLGYIFFFLYFFFFHLHALVCGCSHSCSYLYSFRKNLCVHLYTYVAVVCLFLKSPPPCFHSQSASTA